MSDTSWPRIFHYGTAAERAAFVPAPPSSGQPIYIWYETDTGNTYLFDTTWHQISGVGGATINFSAGTTSNNLGSVVFSDSNGVAFGLSGSTITASVVGGGGAVNFSAGTTSSNLTQVKFSNSNNVEFGLGAGSVITARASINISAGTTSGNVSAFTFSNGSGVSFGFDGTNITASVNALSAINISAGTTSNNLTAFTFANGGGVSFGLNASVITATINTSLTNINVSAGTTSNNLSAITFSNANNVSFGLNGSTITATVTVASTQGSIRISAGTTSVLSSGFTFSNSNNVSFGIDNGTITATASFAGGGGSVNFSAGTTSNNLTAITFSNSNNASFGLNGSTMTVSAPVNFSAGTTSQNLTQLSFSDANNVSFGLNGGTITASVLPAAGATLSYYENLPFVNVLNAAAFATNVGIVGPMVMPNNVSFSYYKLPMSISVSQYTIGGTSNNTTWTASFVMTYNATVYTRGTGASSESFLSFRTSSAGETVRTIGAAGANGSQYTISFHLTYPRGGDTSSFSTSYACSSASYVINTGSLTLFGNTLKFMEMPFNSSFSQGNYWFGVAHSASTSNNGGPTALSSGNARSYVLGVTQANNQLSQYGQTLLDIYYQNGVGRLNNTTLFTGYNSSQISSIGNSAPMLYFQGIRKA